MQLLFRGFMEKFGVAIAAKKKCQIWLSCLKIDEMSFKTYLFVKKFRGRK